MLPGQKAPSAIRCIKTIGNAAKGAGSALSEST